MQTKGLQPLLSIRWQLFLFSAVSLFLELLIIRWMSADIRAFTVFKSFPLVAVYVGLGLGFAFGSKNQARWFPLALLLFAGEMQVANWLNLGQFVFPSNSFDWQTQLQLPPITNFLCVFPLLLAVPLWLSFTVGSAIAPLFESLPPLIAYSMNLAGALVGSLLFAGMSFTDFAPWMLLVIPVVVMLALFQGSGKQKLLYLFGLGAAVVVGYGACAPETGAFVFWSPYQRLDIFHSDIVLKGMGRSFQMYMLKSNHGQYLGATDLTPARLREGPVPSDTLRLQVRWMLPFQLRPFDNALVVASGMGSDVCQGLLLGAKSIDAVDIDPVIIQLGKDLHPLRPYSDPRTTVICDDARHYLSQCKKKYDIVVLSHLDSQTVLGASSSVRLDNYIYTQQGIRSALSVLKPDGLLVLSFYSSRPWFANRLYATISATAGYQPLTLRTRIRTLAGKDEIDPNTVFVLGRSVRDGTFQLPAWLNQYFVLLHLTDNNERILTDDWPYLYLENKAVDTSYLAVLAEIIAIVCLCSRRLLFTPAPSIHWQLFFMGGAFMLMELQFISRLSILFGATWITTSIVINGMLVMILCANYLVIKRPQWFTGRMPQLYALLMVLLLASYFLPMGRMLAEMGDHQWLTYAAISLVTFLPVLVVAVIFAISFENVSKSTRALAFNMLGAVMGALLEYISNFTGINALLIAVMVLYGISYLFSSGRTLPAAEP